MKSILQQIKLMACILLILAGSSKFNVNAQDYIIDFDGTGASTTIDSVIVENLTQGTKLTLRGSDFLHLMGIVPVVPPINNDETTYLVFYPNPMQDYANVKFITYETDVILINLYDLTGRKIEQVQDLLLQGQHNYRIQGLKDGLYILNIISGRDSYSGKLVCYGSTKQSISITYQNTITLQELSGNLKSTNEEVVMQYNTLDRLKFTAFSGNYSSVTTDTPNSTTSINFDFSRCTDAEHNNYSTVQIGAQTWMAENLKTTKYRDGTIIPIVTDTTEWANLTTPAYCWYNNDFSNYQIYGNLYNWHTVSNGQLCPLGWHVPSDEEWKILEMYLGMSQEEADATGWRGEFIGGKLKETGYLHWESPNDGATNESGFTALPGGYMDHSVGGFKFINSLGFWWTNTESLPANAFYRDMTQSYSHVIRYENDKQNGMSIRCLKDTLPEGIIKDHDGNHYTTIKIGDQIWMGENLKTTHYNDGIPIPSVTNSAAWRNLSTPGFCWYNNDEATNKNIYGALYNWYTVNTGTLCPDGWHVPTDLEWSALADYLGNILDAGGKMKQTGITNWNSPNTGATNTSGFTALPGGWLYDSFNDLHDYGYFWSSTAYNDTTANIRILSYNSSGITAGDFKKSDGMSVRCMKDYLPGSFEDYETNTYSTVVIGNQIWMGENLKTTHYKDGTPIPLVADSAEWSNLATPGYCWYNNDISNKTPYGALYNGYAVQTGKLCPEGWHIPNGKEWHEFEYYLSRTGPVGGMLKETGTIHWNEPNTGATNESGFTALPGGLRNYIGNFDKMGRSGNIWAYDQSPFACLLYSFSDYFGNYIPKINDGLSVRCLKDQIPGVVEDISGNSYKTVKIGNQVWMNRDLKTYRYNDGQSIPFVTDNNEWSNLNTPGYCWYDNDRTNSDAYGALYNWYAVNTGKLCPRGWRVATDEDWTILTTYLGGESLAGYLLKEADTIHWNSPNNATNQSGFTALPVGYRELDGEFYNIKEYGRWWSATDAGLPNAWIRIMSYSSTSVTRTWNHSGRGMSVRCLME